MFREALLKEGEKIGFEKGEKVGQMRGEKKGEKRGEKRGERRAKEKMAVLLLHEGVSMELVLKVSGLTSSRLTELKDHDMSQWTIDD